jgi:hypothetical protein
MLNDDYRDMLRALSAEGAEYLLVGAYAMAAHGYLRATMDIDLWVKPSTANADAVLRALSRFGAPLHDLTAQDLQQDDTVYQIGVAPRRIDIITGATGLDFAAAQSRATTVVVDDLEIRILSLEDLIANKRATGRTRDLADAEALEALRTTEGPAAEMPDRP